MKSIFKKIKTQQFWNTVIDMFKQFTMVDPGQKPVACRCGLTKGISNGPLTECRRKLHPSLVEIEFPSHQNKWYSEIMITAMEDLTSTVHKKGEKIQNDIATLYIQYFKAINPYL